MTKKTKKNKELQFLLKKQLNQLNKQMDLLQEELRTERVLGLPNETELSHQLEQAKRQLANVTKKIEKTKASIKKRKNEIKLWKENYTNMEDSDKVEGLKQLNHEIKWRAVDIASKESKVSAFYLAKIKAEGVVLGLQVRGIR